MIFTPNQLYRLQTYGNTVINYGRVHNLGGVPKAIQAIKDETGLDVKLTKFDLNNGGQKTPYNPSKSIPMYCYKVELISRGVKVWSTK